MKRQCCYEQEAMLRGNSIGCVLAFLVALSLTQNYAIAAELSAVGKTTFCNNAKAKKYGEEKNLNPADAYEFGLRIQDFVETENLQGLFSLVRGELKYGPRKKYVQEKLFSDIFSSEWRERIIAKEPSCIGDYEARYSLGYGKIWYEREKLNWRNGKWEKGEWTIISIHSDGQIELSKRPFDGSWKYKENLLTSECFTTEWLSSDNYEFYYDHFVNKKITDWDGFKKYIGRYIGDLVPVAPIPSPWPTVLAKELSLTAKLSGCLKNENLAKIKMKDEGREIKSIKNKNGWVETTHCSKDDPKRCLVYKYRLLKRIALKHCGFLAPNLSDSCIDLGLVQISEETGGSMGNDNHVGIYGIVREPTSAETYVIPLVNFDHLNEALNYVDQLNQ